MTTQITNSSSNTSLPRSTPEAQGIPSAALFALVNDAERKDLGLHSLMVLRHSHVVAEGWWAPYGPRDPHVLFSLSKSFASTAAGLAADEGLLSLDDLVVSFFPENLPESMEENLAAMRVRHLLSMSTGHAEDTTGAMRDGAGDWVESFLALPVAHPPGTHFVYNSGATYMVSAIVQKATGETLLDYLRPRLFDPLGITGQTWENSPQGINVGGWGLNIKTEDILRFGQLYLQKGVWQGERLLPEAWVASATSKQVSNGTDPDNDWAAGYGFQFWRCRHGAYRGDGAFGQLCVVLPDQDTVVAMTAGTRDLGGVLNLIWEHLLPAFSPTALPENAAAQAQLADKLTQLSLSAPQGERTSPLASAVSGKTYRFLAQEQSYSAAWDFAPEGAVLTLTDKQGTNRIEVGADEWRFGTTHYGWFATAFYGRHEQSKIAARGAWTDPETYTVTVVFYETPFTLTHTARFTEDRVLLQTRQNVSFGPTEQPPLEGQQA